MVIFGWGPGKQEDLGEVAPGVCPNCHNQVFFHHVRSKKSVRLYFVPVVPYGTDEYMVCPICSRGLQLSGTQLPPVRSMSSATASFRTGRLAEAPYMAQVERFWRQLGVSPAGQQLFTPATPGAAAPAPPGAPAQPDGTGDFDSARRGGPTLFLRPPGARPRFSVTHKDSRDPFRPRDHAGAVAACGTIDAW